MKKKDLQRQIEDLQKRVSALEKARPYTFTNIPQVPYAPPVLVPYVQPPLNGDITIGDPLGFPGVTTVCANNETK